MIASALALALAMIVLPCRTRSRLIAADFRPAARHWRPRWLRPAGIVAVALVVCWVCPLQVVLATAAASATLAVRLRRRTRLRRAELESRSLLTALDVLVRELRAGAHPVAAFRGAAAEAGDSVGASLRAVGARAGLGADVSAGLRAAAARSSLPAHWERLAVCWNLAAVHGLSMATLMRTAQRDIVERARFGARVEAGMAGARATAAILAGLPFVGVALGQLIGADPVQFLLFSDGGRWLLLVGVALGCAGLLWSDRITGSAR